MQGIFGSIYFQAKWTLLLNNNGLFDRIAECNRYWQAYESWAINIRKEPVEPESVDFVEIYSVIL